MPSCRYDDFKNNFQPSGRPHTAYPPYTVGDRAKKLYGHAVAIVGYNNTDYSWTILNRWVLVHEFVACAGMQLVGAMCEDRMCVSGACP